MIKGLYEAHLPVKNLAESIAFYRKLGLELAWQNEKLAFFWIDKGQSWIGLWETEQAAIPYHPSLRHIAFRVDRGDMENAKRWLEQKGIAIKTDFGFPPDRQPLMLPNHPHAHAAIYFQDPDGNSLELIAPLRLDSKEKVTMMSLEEWNSRETKPKEQRSDL